MAFIDPDDVGSTMSTRSTGSARRRFVDPDDSYEEPPQEQWGGPLGIVDAAANIATGMGASAVGGLAGLGTLATGGSLEDANRNLSSIQDKFTWQPKTVEGKALSHVAALPFEYATKAGQWLGEAAGKPFGLEDEGGLAGSLAAGTAMTLLGGRAALKSAPNWVPNAKAAFDFAKAEAKGLRAPNAPIQYAPSKMAELQAASIENAPMLDATQAAQRIGGKLDPAVSNPTLFNKAMSMASGEGLLDNTLSAENAATWAKAGAKELGIKNLSVPELKAGRERAGQPYREIKAIPNMASGAEVQAAIEGVMARDGMTPAVADFVFKDVSPLVSKIVTAAEGGVNGADIVNLSRKLRKDANAIYKQPFPEPGRVALADASKAVSKALEDLAADRLAAMDKEMPGRGYGDLASRWSDARQYIANSHVWENATNADTFKLDPRKLATLTAKDNALTGVAADVGKIANNMPGISKHVTEQKLLAERATRYGVPSLTGLALGSLVGAPGAGAMAGMLTGVIAPPLLRKLITSDKYQAKHAIPQDFRPQPLGSRTIPINKDIPYSGLPAVPGSMVIPDSWREGINAKMERRPLPAMAEDLLPNNAGGAVMTPQAGRTQFPQLPPIDAMPPLLSVPRSPASGRSAPIGIPEQLLPLSEQYPQGIPIGAAEGRMPQQSTPLPKLYPDNPLMQMADESVSTKKISDLVEQIPFDTKFEVANHPLIVKATHDFIDQAANLKAAIAAETNGFKRGQLEAQLRGTEREFMAGWKELGFKNEAQLRDLTQKLYQTGGETQRGIIKTKSLKDLMQ